MGELRYSGSVNSSYFISDVLASIPILVNTRLQYPDQSTGQPNKTHLALFNAHIYIYIYIQYEPREKPWVNSDIPEVLIVPTLLVMFWEENKYTINCIIYQYTT
jgi:hypothetical protein